MPLTHVDGDVFEPEKCEKHTYIVGLRSKLPARSFDKLCGIIDNSIEDTVKAKSGKFGLVYTKTGFLLGHSSSAPHVDVEHFWNKVAGTLIGKTHDDVWTEIEVRHVMKTIGAMVKWRMSLRPEDWLVHFEDSEMLDVLTGREIKIAAYWINKPKSKAAQPNA